MRCAWQAYLNLLPVWMRCKVDKLGKDSLLELRLRLNSPPELVTIQGSIWLEQAITKDDLAFSINAASRYSPWAAASAARGFITAPGGHRLGLCGSATVVEGNMSGISVPRSLCMRVARDFPGIAQNAAAIQGSILVIGKPGSGKTTLLRDLIRQKSDHGTGSVAVVDEREELFPYSQNQVFFSTGKKTDILSGCGKPQGIEMVLRNMGPEIIAVDEITAPEDCNALIHAGWCGVRLLATAHASSKEDLLNRPVYKPIVASGLFQTLLILQPDKSWRIERMKI